MPGAGLRHPARASKMIDDKELRTMVFIHVSLFNLASRGTSAIAAVDLLSLPEQFLNFEVIYIQNQVTSGITSDVL
jgi:hypothetical protein